MALLADTPTWTVFWLAVAAAALAGIALAAVLALVLGGRRRPTAHVPTGLDTELDQARAETTRTRQLAELARTVELDEVLARTLETATAILGVDAATIVLDVDAGPMVATAGLSAEEARGQPDARLPDWGRIRAAVTSYVYDSAQPPAEPIYGSLGVPIRGEAGSTLGTLSVLWRTPERRPADEQVVLLEEIALAAAPAVENARRYREARQLADLDALTGLHNHRHFHQTLDREAARAHRYDRHLALLVIDIDDFKAVNDRVGHLAGDAILAEAAHRVRSVVRGADIACRIGGDELAVILPESTTADAENLYRRIQNALRSFPGTDELTLSAGVAELEPADDAVSLFQRADAALYRAKAVGKGQATAAGPAGGAQT